MSYKLTLTAAERRAIDWVGNRYSSGEALFKLLWSESSQEPEADWDADCDITFTITEPIAWQIRDNADGEDGAWPCFASELAAKMQAFCDSIV